MYRFVPMAAASMRPPHCAGEIALRVHESAQCLHSFNEAPALRGGNRVGGCLGAVNGQCASMRPPHCAGEITNCLVENGVEMTGLQ